MRKASVALVLASSLSLPAMGQDSVPVLVGGEVNYDACGAIGAVTGLDPKGDNFLAVRTGPSTDYAQIDSLHSGDEVHLCDQQGNWYGILYQSGGGGAGDCGVGTPIDKRGPYVGPCLSGWVYGDYVIGFAG